MIDTLVRTMARQEGWFAAGGEPNLPQRNNNPINLIFAGQDGAVCSVCGGKDPRRPCAGGRTAHGFAKFAVAGVGWAAAYRQVALWIQSAHSLEQLITTQAPPNENNTTAYISSVAAALHAEVPHFDPTQPLHAYMP